MEIGQVEAFERAARDGSFTRAAEALGLTQPAVSTRITTLETELGGMLFDRRTKKLQLTPLGEVFLPYARRLLAVMHDSVQEIKNFQAGKLGEVKIAAPAPFVLSFLVDVLAQFRDRHPTVDILIRERNKTTIFDMLQDRVVTLGLVNAPVYDKQFTIIAGFRDPIRAVVGMAHPLAFQQRPLHIEDIYGHTIYRVSMFPRMTAFIDSVVEHARRGSGGAVIKVPMVMARELVSTGKGVTFLPESYVKPAVLKGELTYLDLEDMPPLISQPLLIARKDSALDDVHTAFSQILQATLSHLKT